MCRSIKRLIDSETHATDQEVQEAARQFVRKVSGFRKPSTVNEKVFEEAINEIAHITEHLLDSLTIKKMTHKHVATNLALDNNVVLNNNSKS